MVLSLGRPYNVALRKSTRPMIVSAAKLLHCGDTALSVEFGDAVDPHLSGLVLALCRRLDAARLPGVVEAVPTFRALMVHYDPLATCASDVTASLADLLRNLRPIVSDGRLWTLPVCYECEYAPDLDDVA